MLADKDRIFTNLYGLQDPGLEAAKKRGQWDNTKAILAMGLTTLATRSNIGPTESLGPGSLAMTIIHAAAIINPM